MFHNLTNRYWGNTLLYGYDKTNNLWWWSSNWVYYISAIHGIPITVDSGANCNPSGFLYNSQPYYIVSGGVLWHDGSQWVISSALGYKTEEYEEDSTWYGDAWWSCGTLEGSYTARGSGHGGATKFVEMGKVVGWKSNDKYGVYVPETGSGLTGNKYAGWLTFIDSTRGDHFTDDGTLYNGKPYFTGDGNALWYDGSNWIISSVKNTKDAAAGYWSGATIPGTLARVYSGEDDTDPTAYVLAIHEYTSTVQQSSHLIAQVALWL
jgi:hypothetical protein